MEKTNNQKKYRQNHNNTPAPSLDADIVAAIDRIKNQITEFIETQRILSSNGPDAIDPDEIKKANNGLFKFMWGESLGGNPNLHFYPMKRLRIDRDTSLLKRADLTMFVIDDESAAPKYSIEVYITDRYNGAMTLNRMDDRGVVRGWSKFYLINNGETTEKTH